MNEIALDEVIVGIISLLSVMAGTFVQRGRAKAAVSAVVPETNTTPPIQPKEEYTPPSQAPYQTFAQEDLINLIVNLNTENARLRKGLDDK